MNGDVGFWADVAGILAFIVLVIKPIFNFSKSLFLKAFGPLIEIYKYNKAIRTGKLSPKHHKRLDERIRNGNASPQERDRYHKIRKQVAESLAKNPIKVDFEAVQRAIDQLKNK